jgi:hypothetical protein
VSESSAEKYLAASGILAPVEPTAVVSPEQARQAEQAGELEWSGVDEVFSGRPDPVKFEKLGDTVTGVIVSGSTRQKRKFGSEELLFWEDGRPKLEVILILMTTEGLRTLYVGSWRLENAIQGALRAAGVRGPRPGGRIAVKWVSEEPVKGSANAAKVFDAAYDPPGRKTLAQMLGEPGPVQPELPFPDSEPPF